MTDTLARQKPISEPIVVVRELAKVYRQQGPWPWSPVRDVYAVTDCSLTVGPGEVLALVGQSGSGKTTLSRCILGLETPTRGEVILEGRPWSSLSEAHRRPLRARYQYVPQDALSALDPQQTALEHVVESLTVLAGRPASSSHEEACAMLDRLGLGSRLHALPREMSGGEQRRVTLARVFALRPRLIVADEPTSGLDPDRQESVLQDLIENLPPDSGCVLVTHDMPQVRRWCDRALDMLEGRVIEELRLPEGEPTHPDARMLFDPWGDHDLAQSVFHHKGHKGHRGANQF